MYISFPVLFSYCIVILKQYCPTELSTVMAPFVCLHYSILTISHMCLLSPCNVASIMEDMILKFYLTLILIKFKQVLSASD